MYGIIKKKSIQFEICTFRQCWVNLLFNISVMFFDIVKVVLFGS